MPTGGVFLAAGQLVVIARITITALSLMLSYSAFAGDDPCDNPDIEVSAQSSDVQIEVCTAAELAINFLSDYGLKLNHPIRIEIVEQPLSHHGYSAYGSYDSRNDLVQVMSPQIIDRSTPSPRIYYQAIDATQYRGIVAHEVAHAMIQQNSHVAPLPIGQSAQEYLATVTQLSIMPAETRRQIIDSADMGPWETGDVISALYMAIAPEKFAVKCYLHFQQLSAPQTFVQHLLGSKRFNVDVK